MKARSFALDSKFLKPISFATVPNQHNSTYPEVQEMLSEYQTTSEIIGSTETYRWSWYDLKGDRTTALVIYFRVDGTINDIRYNLPGTD